MDVVAAPLFSRDDTALRLALLNDWQRGFPVCARPFDVIAAKYYPCLRAPSPTLPRFAGEGAERVIRMLNLLHGEGALTRVGGIFNVGAGGAGLLCAMAVPPHDLLSVAARVSRAPEVNHNYERQHRLNLWFVVTAGSAPAAQAVADGIAADTGLDVLRLPMQRAFHIDLGFDLAGRTPSAPAATMRPAARTVPAALRPLAAQLEQGLPLVERPYAALGARCGRRERDVLDTLSAWLADGTLRRLGVIVRHHELGWSHNAMTVFAVAACDLPARGRALAARPGVTLCYERAPAPGWPYTLYAMVHGRSRGEVECALEHATSAAGLAGVPREILFSRRRFKQTGSRYFAEALA